MGMHYASSHRLRDAESDGIIMLSGSVNYTFDTDYGYVFNGTGRTWRTQFVIDGAIETLPSAGTEYEVGFWVTFPNNNTQNDQTSIGTGRSGNPGIAMSLEDSTTNVTLEIGGVIVDTSAVAFGVATWRLVQIYVNHQAGGLVEVYLDGNRSTPAISYTLTAGDITTLGGFPNEFYMVGHGASMRIHSLMALDSGDGISPLTFDEIAGPIVNVYSPTGDGTYTAMTGTYVDVDEVPYSDADGCVATAVNQQETFTHDASTYGLVGGVMCYARIVRGDTSAGANMRFLQDDGTLATSATQSAPGAGHVFTRFKQRRDGTDWGNPGAAGDFNATDFGVESIT